MVIKYFDQFGEILSGYIQYFYFVYFVLSFILLDTDHFESFLLFLG